MALAQKVQDPRAALLAEAKQLIVEAGKIQDAKGRNMAALFRTTFAWVNYTADIGGVTLAEAQERFAKSLKKKACAIGHWYYCGKLISEYGLPKSVDGAAVRSVSNSWGKLSTYHRAKAIQMLKDGRHRITVHNFVKKHSPKSVADAKRHATNLFRAGNFTAQRLKLETLAWATLAAAFYRKRKKSAKVRVVVYVDDQPTIEAEG